MYTGVIWRRINGRASAARTINTMIKPFPSYFGDEIIDISTLGMYPALVYPYEDGKSYQIRECIGDIEAAALAATSSGCWCMQHWSIGMNKARWSIFKNLNDNR